MSFSIAFGPAVKAGSRWEITGALAGGAEASKKIGQMMKSLSTQFFAGIHFNPSDCKNTAQFLERYDTASPWCMPAMLAQTTPRDVAIKLDFRELPDFWKMKDYSEFQ
jgi:hypothetical protein